MHGANVTIVDNAQYDSASETRRAFLKRAVREILDLRAKGDVEAIFVWGAPDFVYSSCGEWSKAPYVPDRCDRVPFGEALRLFNIEYEVLNSEIHDWLRGNQVIEFAAYLDSAKPLELSEPDFGADG